MHLTTAELLALRDLVLASCEEQNVDPDDLPAWDLAAGWPDPDINKLWTVANIPHAIVAIAVRDDGDVGQLLRKLHDPKETSGWALVNGRLQGEVWLVWGEMVDLLRSSDE